MDCIRCGAKFDVFDGSCPTCSWNPDDTLEELAGLNIGDTIQDRYEIQGSLGVGRFGVVLSVMDQAAASKVVMKFYHPAILPDSKLTDRFLDSISDFAKFTHPLMPAILDFGVDEKYRCFITQEHVSGKRLRTLIRERWKRGDVFALQEVVSILKKIAIVYEKIPGFVHGSLSPKRIWLSSDDPWSAKIKVTGAGIVRYLPPQVVWHRLRALSASRGYAPPELLMGRRPDQFSDVYAAGVMIAEMLTAVPFEGRLDVYRDSTPKLADDIYSVVERALLALPNQRYVNLAAMVEAIEEFSPVEDDAVKPSVQSEQPGKEQIDSPSAKSESDFGDLQELKAQEPPEEEEKVEITSVTRRKKRKNSDDDDDLFDDTAQISMEEVIRAHIEYGDRPPIEPDSHHSDDARPSQIEPVRPVGASRAPSFAPPPGANTAPDPSVTEQRRDSNPRTVTSPGIGGILIESETRRDRTQELDLSDAEMLADPTQENRESSTPQKGSTDQAVGKLEEQALDAEKMSINELLRRAGRLDGVDPRLVRAAHTLESERLRDKSIKAANLIREKSDDLNGIDPRLLRAAAKLEGARVDDGTEKKKKKTQA